MFKVKNLFSQRDSRWGSIALGLNTDKKYTIGGWGCLTSSLGMVVDVTPDAMNTKLLALGENVGFWKGTGYYCWGAFTKLFGIKERLVNTPAKLTDGQIKEIQVALDNGYPVMLGIDADPMDYDYDTHYVLAVDYSGENFTIADPWVGTLRPLKDYCYATKPTARDTIEQYIVYEVQNSTEGQMEALQSRLDNLQVLYNQTNAQVKELQKKKLIEDDSLRSIIKDIEAVIRND